MTFNPMILPAKAYKAYKLGVGAWPLVVQRAVEQGVRGINCLTDIVFYLHHPELGGRPIASGETGLIDEWKRLRILVRQRAPAHSGFQNGMDILGISWSAPSTANADYQNGTVFLGTSWNPPPFLLDSQFRGGVRVSTDSAYGGPDKAKYDLTISR